MTTPLRGLWAVVCGDGSTGRAHAPPDLRDVVCRLCALSVRSSQNSLLFICSGFVSGRRFHIRLCTGAAAGRFECGIKGCNHPVPHRPTTRAGNAVLKRIQPLFRIFLAGPVLSLFWQCNQICYHLAEKCRSFKCAITTILLELEVFLNGR